eukprot:5742936-Prymnesium_polylepis.2
MQQRFANRVAYVDCGEPFKLGDGVRTDLMPDTLHPNAEGYRLWAGCLEPAIAALEALPS